MDKPLELLEQDIDDAISVGSIPLITGESGVGKTALVESLARKRKMPLYTIIGSLCEPTDINGFPVVDDEPTVDAAGRRHKVVRFAPRDFLVEITEKHDGRAVIFFDELTSTTPGVMAAELRTMMDKKFGDYALDPHKVAMVAACNPPDLAANGQELPIPMCNRLVHFSYPCDHAAALEWAGNFVSYWGAPPRVGFDGDYVPDDVMIRARSLVAGFIVKFPSWWHYTLRDAGKTTARPEEAAGTGLTGLPTARSWDRVSRHVGRCMRRGRSVMAAARLVAGEVGAAAAVDFQTYVSSADIPDPEVILLDPKAYRPSGRVDVDFVVMGGVVAAVEARPTAARLLACLQVCNNVVEFRGAYEAGAVAVGRLGKLLNQKALKTITDADRIGPDAVVKLKRDLSVLLKPYMSLCKNLFADMGE